MDINPREKNLKTRLSQEDIEFVTSLRKRIDADLRSRSLWEDKLVVNKNQRLGMKRITNKPYPGAPNIPLPETDKQIRKRKPNFVMSVLGQKKPAIIDFAFNVKDQQSPEMQEMRRLAEIGFNWVLTHKMDLARTLTIAADTADENGFCIFKVVEEFKVEYINKTIDLEELNEDDVNIFKSLKKDEKKILIADFLKLDPDDDDDKETIDDILKQYSDGKEIVTYRQKSVSSWPRIIVIEPEKIIVPKYTTKDLQNAERITERIQVTERILKEGALNGAFNKAKVDKIIETKGRERVPSGIDDRIQRQKDANEGINESNNDEIFELYVVSTWRPTGKDGRFERWVFTIVKDEPDDDTAVIQMIRFPYEYDAWNYDKYDVEIKDDRYYSSRGIPEQIRAIQEFMERAINNMLIRDDINNNPVFTVLSKSKVSPQSNRFMPGQVLRVNSHDEIQELGNRQPRVDLSSQTILATLKAFAEEYLASNDQLFRNSTNAGGGKTLGEIDRALSLNQNVLALDIMLWNETIKQVYYKVWKVMQTRLGEPIIINDAVITRAHFQFEPEITPTGSIGSLNKMEEVQKALARVQMIMQQIQMGLIATPEDLFNAMEDYLEKDGVRNPERYITRPEVVAEGQQKVMQQQQMLLQQANQEIEQKMQMVQQKAMAQEVNSKTEVPRG